MFKFRIVRIIKRLHTDGCGTDKTTIILTNLSKLGAQTMARFLACMLVSDENEAILTRCCIRYSRVLMKRREIFTDLYEDTEMGIITAYL